MLLYVQFTYAVNNFCTIYNYIMHMYMFIYFEYTYYVNVCIRTQVIIIPNLPCVRSYMYL